MNTQLTFDIPEKKKIKRQPKHKKGDVIDIMQMTKHKVSTIHINVDGTLSVHFLPIYECSAIFDDAVKIDMPGALINGYFLTCTRSPKRLTIKLCDWTIERK